MGAFGEFPHFVEGHPGSLKSLATENNGTPRGGARGVAFAAGLEELAETFLQYHFDGPSVLRCPGACFLVECIRHFDGCLHGNMVTEIWEYGLVRFRFD